MLGGAVAGAPKILDGAGGAVFSRGFAGSVNAGGIGSAVMAGAFTPLPNKTGGVLGREESDSASCFAGGTHEPNCGLGEAGCGTIGGDTDFAWGTKLGASTSPVRGALARGELLTGRVPVVLGVMANGEDAGSFGRGETTGGVAPGTGDPGGVVLWSLTGEIFRGGGEGEVDNVMVGNSAFGVVDRDLTAGDRMEVGTTVGSGSPSCVGTSCFS